MKTEPEKKPALTESILSNLFIQLGKVYFELKVDSYKDLNELSKSLYFLIDWSLFEKIISELVISNYGLRNVSESNVYPRAISYGELFRAKMQEMSEKEHASFLLPYETELLAQLKMNMLIDYAFLENIKNQTFPSKHFNDKLKFVNNMASMPMIEMTPVLAAILRLLQNFWQSISLISENRKTYAYGYIASLRAGKYPLSESQVFKSSEPQVRNMTSTMQEMYVRGRIMKREEEESE